MKKSIDPHITCAFLYPITRYGYPPSAREMEEYIREMAELGFRSVELEGIGGEHLTQVYEKRFSIGNVLEEYDLKVPVFLYCIARPYFRGEEYSQAHHGTFPERM
ncbi:MAG: hypothetical protein LUE93_02955 [Bacteroides sp.]|nr:hypothetical protein [Bacteroides sp.]